MTADDWRLMDRSGTSRAPTLRWAKWWPYREGWDHDHCVFCFVHFGDHVFADDADTQLEGYVTEDDYHWICRRCFEDFQDRFGFAVSSN